MDLIKSKV